MYGDIRIFIGEDGVTFPAFSDVITNEYVVFADNPVNVTGLVVELDGDAGKPS